MSGTKAGHGSGYGESRHKLIDLEHPETWSPTERRLIERARKDAAAQPAEQAEPSEPSDQAEPAQASDQLPGQMPDQLSNQLSNQHPGQLSGQASGQATDAAGAAGRRQCALVREGGPNSRDDSMFADIFFVNDSYLQTMQAHLLQGRFFSAQDTPASPRVIIINHSMAARLWPNQNPVGKHIAIMNNDWRQIVGVVADVRADGAARPAGLQVYLCAAQFDGAFSDLSIALRTHTDPMDLADTVRRTVHSIDPALPVYNLTSVQVLAAQSVAGQSTAAALMGALGLLALLLASAGVYGVVPMPSAVAGRSSVFASPSAHNAIRFSPCC